MMLSLSPVSSPPLEAWKLKPVLVTVGSVPRVAPFRTVRAAGIGIPPLGSKVTVLLLVAVACCHLALLTSVNG